MAEEHVPCVLCGENLYVPALLMHLECATKEILRLREIVEGKQ